MLTTVVDDVGGTVHRKELACAAALRFSLLKIVFVLIAAEPPLSPSPPAMVQRFDIGIAERV